MKLPRYLPTATNCRLWNPFSVHHLVDTVRQCPALTRVAKRNPLEVVRMMTQSYKKMELNGCVDCLWGNGKSRHNEVACLSHNRFARS